MKRIIFSTVCAIAVLLTVCVPASAEATMTDEEAYGIFCQMPGFSDCYTQYTATYETLSREFVFKSTVSRWFYGNEPERIAFREAFLESVTLGPEWCKEYDENDPSTYATVSIAELDSYTKKLFGPEAEFPLTPENEVIYFGQYIRRKGNEYRVSAIEFPPSNTNTDFNYSYPDRYEFDGENTLRVYIRYIFPDYYEKPGFISLYSSSDKSVLKGYTQDNYDYPDGILSAINKVRKEIRETGKNWFSPDLDRSPLAPYDYLYTEYVMTYRMDRDGNWRWINCELTEKNPYTSDFSPLPAITAAASAISVAAIILLRMKTRH